ncbi:MAG: M20/M25/M40 family metallo-hydrolase [Desulfobacula sp.]|nr:M20/M25/M40 family metallo-hydrolase [Desulfobacula sp.]
MNINSLNTFIEKTWDTSVIPSLMEYITIPAVSPAFNPEWNSTSHLSDTLKLAQSWCNSTALDNAEIKIINKKDRTPILLLEIDATTPEIQETILMYGHLDKQPPGAGWDENKGAWTPVIENDRLYGRGAADDGYSIFTAVTAIKALQAGNIPHARCVILIETCEESGSFDLEYYLEICKDTIRTPNLIVCLDSGCADYERMWITTSLRGVIIGELEARILTQDIHSGRSGMVASSFRILRQVLDRIEDSKTGKLLIEDFYAQIPDERLTQMQKTAKLINANLIDDLPLLNGACAMSGDPLDLLINSTWKPAISYIGAQGIPQIKTAGNVIREYSKLLLSIRMPPTVDTTRPAQRLKALFENNSPYGAKVTYKLLKHAKGWDMPQLGNALEESINNASNLCFEKTPGFAGEGGSIPFMTLLAQKFPQAKFLITGVLGPKANAHGPNEFLHLPYVKKLNLALSIIIGELGGTQ